MPSKKDTGAKDIFTPLDQNDSYTEATYHWKPVTALPARFAFKSEFWKIESNSSKLKVTKDEQRVFDDILRDEMHLWTTFIH